MDEEKKTSPALSGAAAQALEAAFAAESDTELPGGETPPPAPETPAPRKKKLRWLWLLLAVAVIAAAGIGVTSWQYQSRFLPHTRLCGVDVSSLPPAEASARLAESAGNVLVALRDGDGTAIVSLPLTDLVSGAALDRTAAEAFAAQHRDMGLFRWLTGGEYSYDLPIREEHPVSALLALLRNTLYGDTPRVHPEDAYIQFTDTGYTLVPEVEGNLVDLRACAETLSAALDGFSDLTPRTVDAKGKDLRLLPEITADSRRIQRQCEHLDAYMATPVTLDFQNGNTYTLTPEDIWSLSDAELTRTSARCTPDPVRAAALARELAKEYGDDGVYAKFRNVVPTRELIYYRVGDKGWIMDHAAMGGEIARLLSDGEGGTLTPIYDYTWYWDGYYNCGDTFVEISIDNQYMWYFLDGKLLVETPVVTGNLSTGGIDNTRRGYFQIYYMVTDVFLSGPTWNDHVDYWMPFDGGIGLHDSSWRDEYGGDIYITDGSHGCINTPLEAIGIIYNNIWDGVPVIVY